MRVGPGHCVAAVVLLAALAPLVALFRYGDGPLDLAALRDPYLLKVLRFSLWQASLSTVLSVAPAILVARALANFGEFRGRRLVVGLFGLPLVVPAIVVVLGVIGIFGAGGWMPLGRGLYGLTGILIAHVFFNLPLAARLLLPALERVPASQWRLARQLGVSGWRRWRLVEWPALRAPVADASLIVFMLCLTSFAVVLGLGGGPRSTTLEVAIYQSLRFDFEPSRAALLAILQLSLCTALAILAASLSGVRRTRPELCAGAAEARHESFAERVLDALWIGLAVVVVGGVLAVVVLDGLRGPLFEVLATAGLWRSAAWSLCIALASASLAACAGWCILKSSTLHALRGERRAAHALEIAASVVYVAPPLVIGTGLFLLFAGRIRVELITAPVVIAVNALVGLPFVVRALRNVMERHAADYERLCSSLGITGLARFRSVDFPLLRKPLATAAALVAALSFGDLGVVALFAGHDWATLPLLLYRSLSAYRMPEAAVTSLFLLASCLAMFVAVERLVGGR